MTLLPDGTITFLFTDIEGSTGLWDRSGTAMRDALAVHDRLLSAAIETHQGQVVKSRGEGDSFFAVFPKPSLALVAAIAIQEAIGKTAWPGGLVLTVRTAIHTGEAELRDGDYFGPDVNRCARLRSLAAGGQILVSSTSAKLAAAALPEGAELMDLGEHALRGIAEAEHVFQLCSTGLERQFPALRSGSIVAGNLPAAVSDFVGRGQEMAELEILLKTTRLLVITGFGGTGKTRLALELATRNRASYRDGAWFVELSEITDALLVPQTLAAVVGVRESPGIPIVKKIVDHLRADRRLIVFDTCEHLLDATAELIGQLLRECPGVQVAATSREPLKVQGEKVWQLGPLPQADSVALFRLRSGSLPDDKDTATAIGAICSHLDGIPLAIELAAARTGALSPLQILERLEDRFKLLSAPGQRVTARQQTLRATIDWSCRLLAEGELRLFQDLSVFDGFTLDAAEAVFPDEDILDRVGRLLDKSLLLREMESRTRYRMLETIRAYARDGLEATDRGAAIRRRHAEYFTTIAIALAKSDPAELETELDNIRSALRWCRQNDTSLGLRLANGLGPFWPNRGFISEGSSWLRSFVGTAAPDSAEAALAHHELGWLAIWHVDDDTATREFQASVSAAEASGDRELVNRATNALVFTLLQTGRRDEARTLASEAIPALRSAGDPVPLAQGLYYLMLADFGIAPTAVQLTRLHEARELFSEAGSLADIGMVDANIALEHIRAGDVDLARASLRDALEVRRRRLDLVHVGATFGAVAAIAALTGRHEDALRLIAFDRELRARLGIRLPPMFDHDAIDPIEAGCREVVGDRTETIEAEGRAMEISEAIAFAIAINEKV